MISKKITTKSMRLAVISMVIAVISLISTISILMSFNHYTGVSAAFNGLSPLFILAGFVVALFGLFSKGANWKTRAICVSAIFVIILSLFIFIFFNSITGIV